MITIQPLPILPRGQSKIFDAVVQSNAITNRSIRIGLVAKNNKSVVLYRDISEADRKEVALAIEEHYGEPATAIKAPPPIVKELLDEE